MEDAYATNCTSELKVQKEKANYSMSGKTRKLKKCWSKT